MERVFICGERGSGKTTLCQAVINLSRSQGYQISGVYCPAVFKDGKKVAIDAVDLRTGVSKRLAARLPEDQRNPQGLHWDFDKTALDWGNEVLRSSYPTDVLIIDELGPLEFIHQRGWIEGIKAIDAQEYQLCILVIRPELLQMAQRKWPGAEIYFTHDKSDSARISQQIIKNFTSKVIFQFFTTGVSDREWVDEYLIRHWGSKQIIVHGEMISPSGYFGIGVKDDDTFAGLITYRVLEKEIEILTLNSQVPGKGIARKLLARVIQEAAALKIKNITLTTTNDNLRALKVYQNFGFTITGIDIGAIQKSRKLKPQIPFIGENNIPILDEIRMEFSLDSV